MKRHLQLISLAIVCLLVSACGTSTSHLHQTNNAALPDNIGLQGYSPISYFEQNRAERGDPQFSAVYRSRVFYFTSAEQVRTFEQNPARYMPRYGEYCPYSLALGRRVAIDPTNFKIVDDRLLLFHDSVELSSVDVKSQQDIFEEADRQFKLINF